MHADTCQIAALYRRKEFNHFLLSVVLNDCIPAIMSIVKAPIFSSFIHIYNKLTVAEASCVESLLWDSEWVIHYT